MNRQDLIKAALRVEDKLTVIQNYLKLAFFELELDMDYYREVAEAVFAAYGDSSRHYHNIDHIIEMCDFMTVHVPEHELLGHLIFASIYHDYIDPRRTTAVEDSALEGVLVHFRNSGYFLADKYRQERITANGNIIAGLILATKSHESDIEIEQIIIDADLERFLCPTNLYAQQIRLEYADIPDEIFIPNRKRVLEYYGAREPFYYKFGNSAEAKAQIQRQLKELSNI